MTGAAVPTCENGKRTLGRAVRRLVLFEAASKALGGAAKLGEALGVTRRAINHKLGNDRALTASDMLEAAAAVEAQARVLMRVAAELRELAA